MNSVRLALSAVPASACCSPRSGRRRHFNRQDVYLHQCGKEASRLAIRAQGNETGEKRSDHS